MALPCERDPLEPHLLLNRPEPRTPITSASCITLPRNLDMLSLFLQPIMRPLDDKILLKQ